MVPLQKNHIIAIENVQRRATKELPGLRSQTYIERLKSLKLPSLANIRLRGDTIDVLKNMHNLYDTESSPKLLNRDDASFRTGNRGHTLKLFTQRSNTNIRKHAFPLRVTEP